MLKFLKPMEAQYSSHANLVTDSLEDFNTIQSQLSDLHGKLANRTTPHTGLTVSNTHTELREIEMRLAHK